MISRLPKALLHALYFLPWVAFADANWAHWRGPHFDGSTEASGLPARFDKTENVLWTTDLPGPAAATPVVWGDHVLVNSTDASDKSVVAMDVDRKSGSVRWRHKLHDGDHRDERSNYAAPSPVTDGRHVWFFTGNGELVCFDLKGNEVWRRNLQKDFGAFTYQWTPSTSPLLFEGRLYVQVLQRNVPVHGRGRTDGPNESYLLAVNPGTGKDLWRHVRPSQAREESLEAFSSPVPFTAKGRTELLIVGGDDVSGHEPGTGREIWRWGTWNNQRIGHWRLVPSPVGGGGVVLACAPKGSPVFAVKAGGSGTLDNGSIAWQSADRELSSDVSTPLFYRGRFYVMNSDKRKLFAVEPATGRILSSLALSTKAKVESSPTAADGKIYFLSHSGDLTCVEAGDTLKELHMANMADGTERDLRSSVAIAHNQLFVRTGGKLYCIGRKH